ncbi:hypothetical protein ACWDD9_43480 [Kitasatospora sp. NPDC001119]|uniref:hypothetical protein n=1 Tax=Kitasatospora sp. MY 5-36 TaxID=1678027 RepID=UPI0006709064|nr:hypothetical protein [Kitasatospora sp. MY 5-36]
MSALKSDPVLVGLIRSVEKLDFSVSVTLTTTGGVVIGNLVSGREWANDYRRQLEGTPAAAFFDEVFENLAESLATKTAENEEENQETDDDGETDDDAEPQFIHLTKAQYLSANELIPHGNPHPWRGRLDQIVAWSLGALSTS